MSKFLNKKLTKILIILLFPGGFFCFRETVLAANSKNIVINEIGAYEKSEEEWIEIFNRGNKS